MKSTTKWQRNPEPSRGLRISGRGPVASPRPAARLGLGLLPFPPHRTAMFPFPPRRGRWGSRGRGPPAAALRTQ